ncbi:uncharacterized protein [Medicago truncatula]|uniref:uncharacterized protein n=1 Tax=Medicago truncatula TaxID=3880 RepID=UPI0019679E24|nr:uncharacterized protein LOC120577034 [Medicago truncatula]
MASKGKGVHVGGTSCGTKKQGKLNERGLILNKSERERYKMLLNRDIVPNRYPDSATLQALGIDDNVTTLISNIGWKDFVGETHFTFETSTFEFLSTVNFNHDTHNTTHPNHTVSFSLGNVEYNMSLTEFSDIMGFESTGVIHVSRNHDVRHRGYDKHGFWFQITGRKRYECKTAKASMIQNSVFRYLHRVMACTIFGRPETATVRSDELFLLWAMVHKCPVNTGYYLLDHLTYVAEQPKDLDSRVPKEGPAKDEEMGDYREDKQPTEGSKDDNDWRQRMEAKVDRTYEEVALVKHMLAATMRTPLRAFQVSIGYVMNNDPIIIMV